MKKEVITCDDLRAIGLKGDRKGGKDGCCHECHSKAGRTQKPTYSFGINNWSPKEVKFSICCGFGDPLVHFVIQEGWKNVLLRLEFVKPNSK